MAALFTFAGVVVTAFAGGTGGVLLARSINRKNNADAESVSVKTAHEVVDLVGDQFERAVARATAAEAMAERALNLTRRCEKREAALLHHLASLGIPLPPDYPLPQHDI